MGKTAQNGVPWCYYRMKAGDDPTRCAKAIETKQKFSRPFGGVFRMYFLDTQRSRWGYAGGHWNGTKYGCQDRKYKDRSVRCPRFPVVEVFMWKPGQEFVKKLNRTVPVFRPVPGFFKAIPAPYVPGPWNRAAGQGFDKPRMMLFHGELLPTFSRPREYLKKRYRLDGNALEHGVCKSGT